MQLKKKILQGKGKTANKNVHREAKQLIPMTRVGQDLGTKRPEGQSDLMGVALPSQLPSDSSSLLPSLHVGPQSLSLLVYCRKHTLASPGTVHHFHVGLLISKTSWEPFLGSTLLDCGD